MQIWLDTINLEVVADAVKKGVISGITTNPTILSRTKNVKDTLNQILEIQNGPVAVQVTSNDIDNMINEGESISDFSDRIVVKVPVSSNGLIVMNQLRQRKIPVLGTGVFYPNQVLLAANHNASYISPYFSHMSEIGNAHELLKSMVTILRANQYQTKLLAASLRSIDDLIYCSLIGVDAVTIKEDLYCKLVSDHHLWEKFSHKFQSDWQQTHGNSSIKDLLTTFECFSMT